MLDLKDKTLLVIAPHPDDEVIGCGGLISRVKDAGGKVYVLFLTVGSNQTFGTRGHSTQDQRLTEIENVATLLHLDGWEMAFPGDKYHLQLDRLSQKELIHKIEQGLTISLESTKPDIVTMPIFNDYNQDHRATASAAFTACRPVPRQHKFVPNLIMSYETPMDWWSLTLPPSRPNIIVSLTTKQAKKKLAAMNLYQSQVREKGHPRHVDSLEALMRLRGSANGTEYAEAYYAHKIVCS